MYKYNNNYNIIYINLWDKNRNSWDKSANLWDKKGKWDKKTSI